MRISDQTFDFQTFLILVREIQRFQFLRLFRALQKNGLILAKKIFGIFNKIFLEFF